MAPEVFDGQRTLQTDIWAVGALFYQLLAGRLPFPQRDMPSLLKRSSPFHPTHFRPRSRPPSRQIVARALEKSPAVSLSIRDRDATVRCAKPAARFLEELGEEMTLKTVSGGPACAIEQRRRLSGESISARWWRRCATAASRRTSSRISSSPLKTKPGLPAGLSDSRRRERRAR